MFAIINITFFFWILFLGACLNTLQLEDIEFNFFPIQLFLKWYSSFKKGWRWLNKDILVGATWPHICLPQPCNFVAFRLDNKWKIFNGWKVKNLSIQNGWRDGEEGWKYEELKLHIHSFHNLQIFLNITIFLLWFPLQKYALQLLIPSTTIQNFVSLKLVSDKNKKNC